MMKHEDMITLIGNMFINAYVAGDRKDLESFRFARADRDRMFDEIKELYAELEQESYNREQLQVELNKALHKLEGLQRDYDHMCEIKDRLLMLNRKWDDHSHPFADDVMMGDDAGKFSEQDLPFPDIEEIAPAEEVEGSDE